MAASSVRLKWWGVASAWMLVPAAFAWRTISTDSAALMCWISTQAPVSAARAASRATMLISACLSEPSMPKKALAFPRLMPLFLM